jgi:hypothetical protein
MRNKILTHEEWMEETARIETDLEESLERSERYDQIEELEDLIPETKIYKDLSEQINKLMREVNKLQQGEKE